MIVAGLVEGGDAAERALDAFTRFGLVLAGGNARRALDVLADSYVADPEPGKIALTWSRADAQAATRAIRSKLDDIDPARATFNADAPLKPEDRIRFFASTPWVPSANRRKDWAARRVHAGERAEVIGLAPETDDPILRIAALCGQGTRDMVLTEGETLPKWDYAFAGTIHGESTRVREHVHLLVSPGMTRQFLAAGAAVHLEKLKLVVPSSDAGMSDILTRITEREGRAATVLDYGFDSSLGAREAMHGASADLNAGDGGEKTPTARLDKAINRLARLAEIYRAASLPALDRDL